MKTFEEKFTAWVDGKLVGAELADFERGLVSLENAEAEKAVTQRIGELLRKHLPAPKFANADFFNHQLMQSIAEGKPREKAPERHSFFWTLPRMAWAGACCLALAFALYLAAVPKTQQHVAANQQYVAKILNAQTDDPTISATAYHDNDENVTVLWLGGLDYLPQEKQLK